VIPFHPSQALALGVEYIKPKRRGLFDPRGPALIMGAPDQAEVPSQLCPVCGDRLALHRGKICPSLRRQLLENDTYVAIRCQEIARTHDDWGDLLGSDRRRSRSVDLSGSRMYEDARVTVVPQLDVTRGSGFGLGARIDLFL
jgi:hypothetical protein